MTQTLTPLLKLCVVQFILISICAAYPYILVPQYSSGISKRSFDRIDNAAFHFGSKRAFDRLDGSDFGLVKRNLFKRAFDRLDMADFGLRRKRAFDRLARSEFGFRRKRSFDRLGGTEFGLMKRSLPSQSRDSLISELTESILALRKAQVDMAEADTPSVMVAEYLENEEK